MLLSRIFGDIKKHLERPARIELATKPWQGLVLPLAPWPHCLAEADGVELTDS
jgi:hypothetical protein